MAHLGKSTMPPASSQSDDGDEASDMDLGWTDIVIDLQGVAYMDTRPRPSRQISLGESMQGRIVRVTADENELLTFHNISLSQQRHAALDRFYQAEMAEMGRLPFARYCQDDKVDYVLLRNYLRRSLQRLNQVVRHREEMATLIPFAWNLITLCEARQNVSMAKLDPQKVAQTMHNAMMQARSIQHVVERTEFSSISRMTAHRTAQFISELCGHIKEFADFFSSYDPLFSWWVSKPYLDLQETLKQLVIAIKVHLVRTADDDAIIGDAIGEASLQAELEAEMIPYTPKQLLAIAEEHYVWCEAEMKKASRDLGLGNDWKAALEHVRRQYGEPGDQPAFIKRLVDEGASYVKKHDLVTIPPLAEHAWRMEMMSPAAQKVNPFFLGGPEIIVSYPTAGMAHADKLASLRSNNAAFARATAFHEMIPGHRLQMFYAARHRPYRALFDTPFYVEGWATYWEMLLWHRGDFFCSPEDRIGTLFWRMHRCARIVFSLRFHLGEMEPEECVQYLVDKVGHERHTAEGEVRRSLAGEYGPLYQAGYLLGAMQLWALREELVRDGKQSVGEWREKEFHDAVLKANTMPIELLRVLLKGDKLDKNYKAKWKFQGEVDERRNIEV